VFTATRKGTPVNTSKKPQDRRTQHGLIGRLNREWDELSTDPTTTTALARWGQEQPSLSGWPTIERLETAVAAGPSARTDGIFHALLTFATNPDKPDTELAARIVLQLMLPAVVRMALSLHHSSGWSEREAIAVDAMYESIVTYPLRRDRLVPANIALDALQIVDRRLMPRTDPGVFENPCGELPDHLHPPAGDRPAAEELARLLVWAVRTNVITKEEASLLATTTGHGDAKRAAAELGMSRVALRKRRSRVISKLRAAAGDYDADLALVERPTADRSGEGRHS
jgi:hypothetical protein